MQVQPTNESNSGIWGFVDRLFGAEPPTNESNLKTTIGSPQSLEELTSDFAAPLRERQQQTPGEIRNDLLVDLFKGQVTEMIEIPFPNAGRAIKYLDKGLQAGDAAFKVGDAMRYDLNNGYRDLPNAVAETKSQVFEILGKEAANVLVMRALKSNPPAAAIGIILGPEVYDAALKVPTAIDDIRNISGLKLEQGKLTFDWDWARARTDVEWPGERIGRAGTETGLWLRERYPAIKGFFSNLAENIVSFRDRLFFDK